MDGLFWPTVLEYTKRLQPAEIGFEAMHLRYILLKLVQWRSGNDDRFPQGESNDNRVAGLFHG
jgi:hypothetical protein